MIMSETIEWYSKGNKTLLNDTFYKKYPAKIYLREMN